MTRSSLPSLLIFFGISRDGDGSFQPPVAYASGGLGTVWVAVDDFNNDVTCEDAFNSRGSENNQGVVAILLGILQHGECTAGQWRRHTSAVC
jgi:hypothetical protein